MKKILSTLPIIALAGLVFFSSCSKKDDDVTPGNSSKIVGATTIDGVNYVNAGSSLAGSTVTLSGSGIIKVVVETKLNGKSIDTDVDTVFAKAVSSYTSTAGADAILPFPGAYEITYTATDSKNAIVTFSTIKLTVLEVVTSSATLGDQAHPTLPSYYRVNNLSTVTSGNFSTSTTDFNFVVLPTPVTTSSVANIISVDERSANGFTSNTGSTRKFYIAETTLNYSTAKGIDVYKAGVPETKKTAVASGKTYLFVTNDGVRGLIKVSAYAAKPGQQDNTVTFDIKVIDATGAITSL